MLKHCVVKGRHVMKPLHVCLIVLQYYARVATGRAGYVLYRALVLLINKVTLSLLSSHDTDMFRWSGMIVPLLIMLSWLIPRWSATERAVV